MFDLWARKIPWRRKWQPTPVFLPGESQGWWSLTGDSPKGHKESGMTEHSLQETKAKNTYCMVLYRKNLLTLAFKDPNSTCVHAKLLQS